MRVGNLAAAAKTDQPASHKGQGSLDVHVGDRVRTLRLMLGMRLERLSEELGVTTGELEEYERGERRIGAGLLSEASKILGAPLSYFFSGAPLATLDLNERPETPRGIDDEPGLAPAKEGRELLHLFWSVGDPDERRRILDFARSIAKGGESGAGDQRSKSRS